MGFEENFSGNKANGFWVFHITINGVKFPFKTTWEGSDGWKLDVPADYLVFPVLGAEFWVQLLNQTTSKPGKTLGLDVAIIANYFAKSGWELLKVRNHQQYLIFVRDS